MWHDKTHNWLIFIKNLPDFKGFFVNILQTFKLLSRYVVLRIIPLFHVITWCGNLVERYSFCKVLGDSAETMRKLCLSTKFSHQEIRWNCSIFCSASFRLWVFQRWLHLTNFQLDFLKLLPLKFFRGMRVIFTEIC